MTSAQAGNRLTCSCGKAVDVPTLRELQSLERIEVPAASRRAREWSFRHGLILFGATIAVVALIVSAWLQIRRPRGLMVVERLMPSSNGKNSPWYDDIQPLGNFKSFPPADVWLTWATAMPVGADLRLTKYGMFAAYTETRLVTDSRDYRYFAWGIGGVGVVLLVVGLLIPERKSRRAPARRQTGSGAAR